jgi:hypothetical protein
VFSRFAYTTLAVLLMTDLILVLIIPSAKNIFFKDEQLMAHATSDGPIDHLIFIVLEKKDYESVYNQSSAPYLTKIADEYSLLTNYHALAHASLPNYLAMIAGSYFNVGRSEPPQSSKHIANYEIITSKMDAKGVTWKAYMESMPSPCYMTDNGSYVVRHNPFVYFRNVTGDKSYCNDHVVDFESLDDDIANDTLPNFVFITPNQNNNGHDTDIAYSDNWLQGFLPKFINSSAFDSSVIFTTFDENEHGPGYHTYTAVLGPPSIVKSGYKSEARYDHFSLLKTIEVVFDLENLGRNDVFASPIVDVFRPEIVSRFSKDLNIKSLDDAEFDIRFAALADTHLTQHTTKPVLKAYLDSITHDIGKQNVHFTTVIGDFIDSVTGHFPEQMAKFHKDFINQTDSPVLLAYGDHGKEWGKYRSSLRVPEAIFGGTFNVTSSGTQGKGWYFEQGMPYMWSMTYNNVHFVFLPSAFADDMWLAWLAKDLSENRNYTTIIFSHHGSYPGAQGFYDETRMQLRSLLDSNPQVIAVISGHTHKGYPPWRASAFSSLGSLGGNAYPFYAWPPGSTLNQYLLEKKYLIFSIRQDGLYIFERDAEKDFSSLVWALSAPTTFIHKPKIEVSTPFLVRDGQTVSIPFTQLQSAKLRAWGVNTTQLVNSEEAQWVISESGVTRQRDINTTIGYEPIVAQRYEKMLVDNASNNWGYIDIFKNKDLTNETRLIYGILLATSSQPKVGTDMQLQFINATSGEVIVSSGVIPSPPQNKTEVSLDYLQFGFGKQNGEAQGSVVGEEFQDMSPQSFSNMTLRIWFGPQNISQEKTSIDIAIWVHQRTFLMAPLSENGVFSSESLVISLNGSSYEFGSLNPFEYVERTLGDGIMGDMKVNIGGSRIALIELKGETDPAFFLTNPRATELISDGTRNIFKFGQNLYSNSATVTDTVLYTLIPAMSDYHTSNTTSGVIRFSTPTASVNLTNILDTIDARLYSYESSDDRIISTFTAESKNLTARFYLPQMFTQNNEFTAKVNTVEWAADWDETNRLLTVSSLTEPNNLVTVTIESAN